MTVSLALGAAVLWLSRASPSAWPPRRPRSLLDRGAAVFVLAGLSMPTFLLGLLFLYSCSSACICRASSWFPANGYVPLTQNPLGWSST